MKSNKGGERDLIPIFINDKNGLFFLAAGVFALLLLLSGCDSKIATTKPQNNEQEALRLPIELLTPPETAIMGPNGVRWLMLAEGDETKPGKQSSVMSEISIWESDGTLLFSNREQQGSSSFTMTTLKPFVREQLGKMGAGGHARVWFPPGTAGSWLQVAWRRLDIIVELKVLSLMDSTSTVTRHFKGAAPYRFVLPEVTGPPTGAKVTAEGIRYIQLVQTKGMIPSHKARLRLELTAWQPSGIMLGNPVFRQRQTITTMSRVPAEVVGVLGKMRIGETVRIWLPENVATTLLSVQAKPETIVDVTLLAEEQSQS